MNRSNKRKAANRPPRPPRKRHKRKRNEAFASVQYVTFSLLERVKMLFAKGYIVELRGEPNRDPHKTGALVIQTLVPAWPWVRLWAWIKAKRTGKQLGQVGTVSEELGVIITDREDL